MTHLKNRIERLETEYRFRRWFHFQRFLEALTLEQLEAITARGHYPEPLPEPLPRGASRLDGLDRKSLMKLWQESERWHAHFRSRTLKIRSFSVSMDTGRSRRAKSRIARNQEEELPHDYHRQ